MLDVVKGNEKRVTSRGSLPNLPVTPACRQAWRYPLLVTFVLWATIAVASGEKSSGADFLRIDPGAHAASMGGSFSALAEDVQALYYNPAGLALVGHTQFTASHMEWLAGMQSEYAAMAFPAGSMGWGVSMSYLHSEETERDALGRAGATFGVGDGALTGGLGVRLTEHHHVGMSVKFLQRHLYHRSANGFAADLGYQYRIQDGTGAFWKFAFTLKNAGPGIGFAIKEKMPTELEGSAAWQPMVWYRRPLTLTVALNQGSAQDGIGGRIGIEGTILSRFHLRAGYFGSRQRSEKLRVGFGVDLFDLGRIDFAAIRIDRFNSSLLMSLTLQTAGK